MKPLLILLLSSAAFAQCGQERQKVKTLSDPAAAQVHLDLRPTTIDAMRKLPAPKKWGNSLPRQGLETQAYIAQADLIGYKAETGKGGDRDYHIVLSVPGKPEETIILEIPHPDCAPAEYQEAFARMRAFVASLGPPPSPKFVTLSKPVPVDAAGVIFFDKLHGQKGVAPNGVEFHPALILRRR